MVVIADHHLHPRPDDMVVDPVHPDPPHITMIIEVVVIVIIRLHEETLQEIITEIDREIVEPTTTTIIVHSPIRRLLAVVNPLVIIIQVDREKEEPNLLLHVDRQPLLLT